MFRGRSIWHLIILVGTLCASCATKQNTSVLKEDVVRNPSKLFLEERTQLVKEDSALYFSANVRLNTDEKRLNQLLKSIQRKQLDQYQAEHFFPPARDFYQSKKHIEENLLFKIIRTMPKGGALHMHSLAMGRADWVVKKAMELPEMYVYWGDDERSAVKGQFRAFEKDDVEEGYVQVIQLCKEDPMAIQQMEDYLTFDESMDGDSVDIWKEFEFVFERVSGILRYEPVFADYLTHACELLIQDNIQHVELRMPFQNYLYNLNNKAGTLPIEGFVNHLETALTRCKKLDPHFTMKVLHQNLRFRSTQEIRTDIDLVVDLKKKYPEWITGYDLVAEEDAGHKTSFHVEEFLRLDSIESKQNVHLPIFLHDGESNWASNDNLYDAILLGSERIGHGFNLFRYPSLIEKVIDEDICIEINPLSNQILGYIRDLRNHPASTYLRRGVNCSISSDDPLIFDYAGLSYDYWSIFMAWELDLAALKKLSQNGLSYSALNETEKEKALAVWTNRWDAFVQQSLDNLNNEHD